MKVRAAACLLLAVSILTGCGQKNTPPVGALERGKTHFRNGEWPQAMEALNEAIASDPNKPEAYVLRGRTFIVQGDIDRAISDYTNAIRLDPKHEEAYLNRAVAYRELGKNRPAEANKLIELANQDQIAAGKLDPAYQHRVEAFARQQLIEEQNAAEEAAKRLKAQRDRAAQQAEEQREAEGLEGSIRTGRRSRDSTRRTRGLGDQSEEALDGRSTRDRNRARGAGDDSGQSDSLRNDRSTRNLKDRYGEPVEVDIAATDAAADPMDDQTVAAEPNHLDDPVADNPELAPANAERFPGLGSQRTGRRSTFQSRADVRRANNLEREESDPLLLTDDPIRLSPETQDPAEPGNGRAAVARSGKKPKDLRQAAQQERRAYYGNPFDGSTSETGRAITPFSEPAVTPFSGIPKQTRDAVRLTPAQPQTPFNTPATTPFTAPRGRELPDSLGSARPVGPGAPTNAPAGRTFNTPSATPFSAPAATPFSSSTRNPFLGPPVDRAPAPLAPGGTGPFD